MSNVEDWNATAQRVIVVMSHEHHAGVIARALYPTAQVVLTVNVPTTQRTATIIAVTDNPQSVQTTANYQVGRLQSFGSFGVYQYETMAAALDGLQDNAVPSRFNR